MQRLPGEIKDLHPADIEACFKIWTRCRPFPGVTLGSQKVSETIDTTSLDVAIVLFRALRAYGWLCRPRTKAEEAFEKVVEMNLGWDEAEDKLTKRDLVESLFTDVSRDAVEGFGLMSIFRGEMLGLITENECFQLFNDRYLWQASPGPEWECIRLGTPYDSRLECNWTGTTSLQDHMDEIFLVQDEPNDGGEARSRHIYIGGEATFIHIPYEPIQARTFDELSKFDLHTVVLDTDEDGKEVLKKQITRYHICAIINLSHEGCEDIRVYDDVGREIEEVVPDFLKDRVTKRKQIPHWTVEAIGGSFELFYYELLEPVDWPVDKSNIPYDPVEFRKRKDHGEESTKLLDTGAGTSNNVSQQGVRNSHYCADDHLDSRVTKSPKEKTLPPVVDDNAGVQQTNPRERWKGKVIEYDRINPMGIEDDDSTLENTNRPRAATRAMGHSLKGKYYN